MSICLQRFKPMNFLDGNNAQFSPSDVTCRLSIKQAIHLCYRHHVSNVSHT